MKYFRIGISLLCVLSICLSAVFFVKAKLQDKTYPVITIDEQIIDVSINVTDEGLLKGVTAYDKKDGDITSKIYIESISKFVADSYPQTKILEIDRDRRGYDVKLSSHIELKFDGQFQLVGIDD